MIVSALERSSLDFSSPSAPVEFIISSLVVDHLLDVISACSGQMLPPGDVQVPVHGTDGDMPSNVCGGIDVTRSTITGQRTL